MTARNRSDEPGNDSVSSLEEAQTALSTWKRRMATMGIALVVSVAIVVPFLAGHSLHEHWDTIGKYLIYLPAFLLSLFMGSAALTYNFWTYCRRLEKTSPKGLQTRDKV